MVEGAQKWYASGLPECKEVEEATRVFLQMKDPIQEFIDERCIVKESKVPITIIHQHYQNWAKNAGYKPEGIIRFGNSMEMKGFMRSRDSKNRYINGIAIKN
jgi:phage/plasmid-associated DNA primase